MRPRVLHLALEGENLMAKGEVLRGECGAALEQLPEEGGEELQSAHPGSRVR
jgi:hypothetical protein